MTNISNMFGIAMKSDLKEKSSPRLITDGKVGIEVELEGLVTSIPNFKAKKAVNTWWDVIKDGSLRALEGHHSAEFLYKGPMFGMDVVDSLESLQKVTKKSISSVRTSVHVHLDVRDLEYQQLLRLLCIYLLVEPIIFDQVTPDRANNPYCAPIRGCSGYLQKLGQSLRGDSPDAFVGNLTPATGCKYTALNFLPIAKQGSIEFRHKEGTNNAESIINWVNVVLALKRYVVETPEHITSDEICYLADNYREFVTHLFRGVHIPNLQESIGVHENGAGIIAKTLLHEADQPILQAYSDGLYDASARESFFWKTAHNDLRSEYFAHYIPAKGTKSKKNPIPAPAPPVQGGDSSIDAMVRAQEAMRRARVPSFRYDSPRPMRTTFTNSGSSTVDWTNLRPVSVEVDDPINEETPTDNNREVW